MPDTNAYLLLGLFVASAVLLVLIGSMAVRYQNLKRDEATLHQLDAE